MSFIKNPLFVFAFYLLVLIAILHNLAIFFYLYWTLWWFDMVMHFLGGLWVAVFSIWLLYGSGFLYKNELTNKQLFLSAVLSSILVGLAWEAFEVWGHIIELPKEIVDSCSDMTMDTLGGVVAFFYSRKYLVGKNNHVEC